MGVATVTREQLLGFRACRLGLTENGAASEYVLALGLQDSPYGVADVAAAIRGIEPGSLVRVWSWRGAPHLHRPADLAACAAGLWPLSDADATKRITSPRIKAGAARGAVAFAAAAAAMREVVTGRLGKGAVSAGVTARIPDDLSYDCGPCGSRHVSGALFQQVGVAAGVEVVAEGRGTALQPLPAGVGPSEPPERAVGTADLLRSYLRAFGPSTRAHLASFLGTTQAVVKAVMPGDVIKVTTPLGPAIIAAEDVDELRAASPPSGTWLVAAGDPWLQARDRDLVVPEAARQKQVWRVLANPGAVLAGGEVVGTWRGAAKGRRLRVTVVPFGERGPRERDLERAATTVARARGHSDADVIVEA